MVRRQTLRLRQTGLEQFTVEKQDQVSAASGADSPVKPDTEHAPLRAADRDFPNRLSGEGLRELAYQRGLARSSLSDMSDAKIREQLRYILQRQYEEP